MEFISKIRSWNVKLIFTFIITLILTESKAQSNGINFQGVARNASGVILASQKIGLRFSVIANLENGTIEYVESRIVNTNPQGIFSVVIGDTGTINTIGTFTNINWKTVPKFLKVEMDPAGGTSFINMGVTQLQKVPYAYYANGVNAANIDGILPLSSGGTGVSSITALKSALGIDLINNTSDVNKPISLATQSALDSKANSSDLQSKADVSDLASKAPIASPTFTGTVNGITASMVGLGNVDNTSDLNKPISTATQSALDLKANSSDISTKASLASPTFTGTVGGITKTMVGLNNVDNTSDLNKPISVATQAVLDLKANSSELPSKAPLESPTFTGTVGGITKTMVGLSNVDNTSDLLKPLSTATINALSSKASTTDVNSALLLKENISNKSTLISLGTSDELYPTQKAVKSYVDAQISAGGVADNGITTVKIADGAIVTSKILDGMITSSKIADNSINSSKIDNGTIINADISNTAAITYTKLNLSGSITNSDISNSAAIPFSKLNITQTDINNLGIPSNADLTTYTAGSGLVLNGTTFAVASNVLTSNYQGSATINGSSFNVTNLMNAGTAVITGTITASNVVANTFHGDGSNLTNILASDVSDGIITSAKISDGTITNGDIASNAAIAYSKLNLSNNITASDIADGTITNSKIANSTLTDSKILGAISVSKGGTGTSTLTTNAVIVGNGTNTVQFILPGTSGNVLKSDGTKWISGAASSSSSFSSDLSVQGIRFGLGGGNKTSNVAIGSNALNSNTTGVYNSALGINSLYTNTSGYDNTAIGNGALFNVSSGINNTSIGSASLQGISTGNNNSAIGYQAYATGNYNNSTAIGAYAEVDGSNMIQLGDNNVTSVKTYGMLKTGDVTYPNTDGTNGQFLSTNGSGTLGWSNVSSSGTIEIGGGGYGVSTLISGGNFIADPATSKLSYMRVGNMVFFTARIGKFASTSNQQFEIEFRPPVASSFTNNYDAMGTISASYAGTSAAVSGSVSANTVYNATYGAYCLKMRFIIANAGTTNTTPDLYISVSGSYIVR